MPRCLFSSEMEKAVMKFYAEIFVSGVVSNRSATDKYAAIAAKVNEVGAKQGWHWKQITGLNIDRKVDTMKRKGRKIYITYRRVARSGAPLEEDFDIDLACQEWPNFRTYHSLFFRNPSFGPLGFHSTTLTTSSAAAVSDGESTPACNAIATPQSCVVAPSSVPVASSIAAASPLVGASSFTAAASLAAASSDAASSSTFAAVPLYTAASKRPHADHSQDDEGTLATPTHAAKRPPVREPARDAVVVEPVLPLHTTPGRCCSASHGANSSVDLLITIQQQFLTREEKRELERREHEARMELDRRAWEDQREQARQEREDRRERERREYEERKEQERERASAAVRNMEREFNARLMADLLQRRNEKGE